MCLASSFPDYMAKMWPCVGDTMTYKMEMPTGNIRSTAVHRTHYHVNKKMKIDILKNINFQRAFSQKTCTVQICTYNKHQILGGSTDCMHMTLGASRTWHREGDVLISFTDRCRNFVMSSCCSCLI
jgi:uncharacterized protein VirK/YbjX